MSNYYWTAARLSIIAGSCYEAFFDPMIPCVNFLSSQDCIHQPSDASWSRPPTPNTINSEWDLTAVRTIQQQQANRDVPPPPSPSKSGAEKPASKTDMPLWAQQIIQGEDVQFGNHQLGDLAFFHNDRGSIIHVGIMLEDNKIIPFNFFSYCCILIVYHICIT